ncbi:MAG: hypothetical protein AABX39_00210 [Nanoarchaeota archaeon]
MDKYTGGAFLPGLNVISKVAGLSLTAYGAYSGHLETIAGGVGLLYAAKVCGDEINNANNANELNNIAIALEKLASATKKPENSDGLVEIARSIDGLAKKLDKK